MADLTLEELAIIAKMMDAAREFGLCHEVKAAYDAYRMEGAKPSEAAEHALYDWDL